MFRAGEMHSPEALKERFADLPAPLCARRGAGRGRALPVLLRRPLHAGMPDAYRCARNSFARSCITTKLAAARDDSRSQHLRRKLRRACPTEVLCEGACVDQILMKAPGADRPPSASRLRHRRRDVVFELLRGRARHGEAGGRRSARGPPGLSCATRCDGWATMSSCSRRAAFPAGSTRWASPLTRSRPSSRSPRSR